MNDQHKSTAGQGPINWDQETLNKFRQLIEKVPVFLRGIAQEKVAARAEKIIREQGRTVINEKDMVDAFFTETPFGFHGPLKCDMEELGINYTQYGYPK